MKSKQVQPSGSGDVFAFLGSGLVVPMAVVAMWHFTQRPTVRSGALALLAVVQASEALCST